MVAPGAQKVAVRTDPGITVSARTRAPIRDARHRREVPADTVAKGRHQRHRVVRHVFAADLVGAVGQAAWVLVAGRHQQQPCRVGRAAGDDHDVGGVGLTLTVVIDEDTTRHRAPDGVGLQLLHLRAGAQRDVGVLQCRRHGDDLGIGLGVHEAGKTVAGVAADAAAVHGVGLVEQDGARCVGGPAASAFQAVGDLLHTRLV